MPAPGERVGALLSVADGVVKLLGYGVYDGDFVPPDPIGVGVPNPRLTLDDSQVVWGCECWWGPEADIARKVEHWSAAGMTVENVNIEAARAGA